MGAYIAAAGANIQTMNFARCFPCAYDIPKMSIDVRCVFTNTLPTGPYRGAGRPEANYAMERLVEEAARVSGIDAVTLRRRNLIAPSAMPYKTAIGTVFDSGNFTPILQDALAASAYKDFRQAAQGGAAGGKTARHRRLVLPGACGRDAARGRGAVVSGRRHHPARHRRALERARSCDDVSAAGRRNASAFRPQMCGWARTAAAPILPVPPRRRSARARP